MHARWLRGVATKVGAGGDAGCGSNLFEEGARQANASAKARTQRMIARTFEARTHSRGRCMAPGSKLQRRGTFGAWSGGSGSAGSEDKDRAPPRTALVASPSMRTVSSGLAVFAGRRRAPGMTSGVD